jgi:hypothetical protein
VVAGQQDRAQAQVPQGADRVGGGVLDGVGHRQHAPGLPVPAGDDGGVAGGAGGVVGREHRGRDGQPLGLEQRGLTHDHRRTGREPGDHAEPGPPGDRVDGG